MINKKRFVFSPALLSILIFCALIFILPFYVDAYFQRVLNTALIFAIVSYGLSIMLGMGGMLSFSGLTFMGLGAYFVANMCSGRLGFWLDPALALLLAPVVVGGVACLLGMVLLKLKGTYFTFSTIALVQVCYALFLNYRPIFGGPEGISNITYMRIGGFVFDNFHKWFYLLVAIVAIVAVFVERIRQTQLGRALASIRDNDTAALTLGVNVYYTKVIAFVIASMLAALAGGLYALHGRFIGSDMFTFDHTTLFIIMVMVGGVNNSFGILFGAVTITALPELLRDIPGIERYLQMFYGLLVVVLMVFMPTGIAGLGSKVNQKIRQKIRLFNTARGDHP